jgi:hypothetical protein
MNVLIDANVVFDVVEKRQPHYAASNQVLCLCRRRVLAGMVAYHTVANIPVAQIPPQLITAHPLEANAD